MKPVTILFCGNFRVDFTTETHLLKSLQSLGHDVLAVQEDETDNDQLLAISRAIHPQIFLWVHTWGWGSITTELLRHLPCPSVHYHLDLVRGIPDRENRVDTSPQYRCTYCFMPDGDPETVTWFQKQGVNYIFLPPAVFHEGCYRAESDPRLEQDVIFVGAYGYHSQWPNRPWLIDQLREHYGTRFTLYEHNSGMREHRLNQLYASAKVVVGDSFCPDFARALYWSDRVPETLGRGGFLIHPFIRGMDDYFRDREHLVYYTYRDMDGLFRSIDYYLEHAEEREQIRAQGQALVQREHTYRQRMATMLDIVGTREGWYTPASL